MAYIVTTPGGFFKVSRIFFIKIGRLTLDFNSCATLNSFSNFTGVVESVKNRKERIFPGIFEITRVGYQGWGAEGKFEVENLLRLIFPNMAHIIKPILYVRS